jgi:hypothetical protein
MISWIKKLFRRKAPSEESDFFKNLTNAGYQDIYQDIFNKLRSHLDADKMTQLEDISIEKHQKIVDIVDGYIGDGKINAAYAILIFLQYLLADPVMRVIYASSWVEKVISRTPYAPLPESLVSIVSDHFFNNA